MRYGHMHLSLSFQGQVEGFFCDVFFLFFVKSAEPIFEHWSENIRGVIGYVMATVNKLCISDLLNSLGVSNGLAIKNNVLKITLIITSSLSGLKVALSTNVNSFSNQILKDCL